MEEQQNSSLEKLEIEDSSILVPAEEYRVCQDRRLLIPFIKHQKIGFINNNSDVIVKEQFDHIFGAAYDNFDCIRVGKTYSFGFCKSNGETQTYFNDKWGVIDSKGNIIIELEYQGICPSDNNQIFTLHHRDKGYRVIKRNGDEIIPYGKYSYIDGFWKGFCRVKKQGPYEPLKNNDKWGIIDIHGNEVLPVLYDNIWNFYGHKDLLRTRIEIDGSVSYFQLIAEPIYDESQSGYPDTEEYGQHFGEYAGTYAQDVAGFSDDVINDAFDGEPDAYWNID